MTFGWITCSKPKKANAKAASAPGVTGTTGATDATTPTAEARVEATQAFDVSRSPDETSRSPAKKKSRVWSRLWSPRKEGTGATGSTTKKKGIAARIVACLSPESTDSTLTPEQLSTNIDFDPRAVEQGFSWATSHTPCSEHEDWVGKDSVNFLNFMAPNDKVIGTMSLNVACNFLRKPNTTPEDLSKFASELKKTYEGSVDLVHKVPHAEFIHRHVLKRAGAGG